MKRNNISLNAKKAFDDFKVELADEFDDESKYEGKRSSQRSPEEFEDFYTNLGRS